MSLRIDAEKIYQLLKEREARDYYVINEDWFSGFVTAEGCFTAVGRNKLNPLFQITQHASDYFLMVAIRDFLGSGKIYFEFRKDGRIQVNLVLSGKENIKNFLLNRLILYPKQAAIHAKYKEWCHSFFPDVILQEKRLLSCDWLAGFTDGDGSFHSIVRQQKDYRIGFQLQAVFDLAQKAHFDVITKKRSTSQSLLECIHEEFFSNSFAQLSLVQTNTNSKTVDHLKIVRAKSLREHVIPLFEKQRLQTRKQIQFLLWKQVVFLISTGQHLQEKNKESILCYLKECKKYENILSENTIKILKARCLEKGIKDHAIFSY